MAVSNLDLIVDQHTIASNAPLEGPLIWSYQKTDFDDISYVTLMYDAGRTSGSTAFRFKAQYLAEFYDPDDAAAVWADLTPWTPWLTGLGFITFYSDPATIPAEARRAGVWVRGWYGAFATGSTCAVRALGIQYQ